MHDNNLLLEVKDLKVHFIVHEGIIKAVDGMSFQLEKGRTLGLIGESGCGKSVTAQAMLRLEPKNAVLSGQILLYCEDNEDAVDILKLKPAEKELYEIRGNIISMIFQEPMKAFSPIHTIGNQIMESLLLHKMKDKGQAKKAAINLLSKVGISNPEQRLDEYPHQLSGGMRQRAMIAMALSCNPPILIADEPTTALDVTIQAQVLTLIKDLQKEHGNALVFITHDLGVIAEMADDVMVMYLGRIVEQCDVTSIFYEPLHPYTKALLESIPEVDKESRTRLNAIEGTVPVPLNTGRGCGFYSRCKFAKDGVCNADDPPLAEIKPSHFVRCFLYWQDVQS